MLIDLSKMERPSYLSSINEHNWRASVRQQSQPNPPNFFRDIMNEYEKVMGAESPDVSQISIISYLSFVINDVDELRSKFYETWGKYREEVIYSDEERRLFETTQAVTRSFLFQPLPNISAISTNDFQSDLSSQLRKNALQTAKRIR